MALAEKQLKPQAFVHGLKPNLGVKFCVTDDVKGALN